ncbi:RimK family alpha-L-glutamate ligase [Candidatus Woesebacteria bacterium]|nr:MAG: RimK family alpha-L-glutamate ligase [Candidatus Woesebacteria bacterium]
MKILIAGLVNNSQLTRLQEEGEKRGHQVDGCYSTDLILNAQNDEFKVHLIGKNITSYDLIYLWAVSKRRWEWYTACYYLSQQGKKVINAKVVDPSYIYYLSPAMDYLRQTENAIPFPKSAILLTESAVDEIAGQFEFPVIVKTASGRQGKGVFKADSPEKVKEIIGNLKNVSMSFVVREFIPNDGDIRVFTIGYKALGAMKRTPQKAGEFRSNISQGGIGTKFNLDNYPEIRLLAEKLSKVTKTEIAGVDIMLHQNSQKPYVLEINPGPQFSGFEKYTNINAAEEIIKYFEEIVAK